MRNLSVGDLRGVEVTRGVDGIGGSGDGKGVECRGSAGPSRLEGEGSGVDGAVSHVDGGKGLWSLYRVALEVLC